jgi:hypothetical protein
MVYAKIINLPSSQIPSCHWLLLRCCRLFLCAQILSVRHILTTWVTVGCEEPESNLGPTTCITEEDASCARSASVSEISGRRGKAHGLRLSCSSQLPVASRFLSVLFPSISALKEVKVWVAHRCHNWHYLGPSDTPASWAFNVHTYKSTIQQTKLQGSNAAMDNTFELISIKPAKPVQTHLSKCREDLGLPSRRSFAAILIIPLYASVQM